MSAYIVQLATFAVALELTVSANLLTLLGVPYVSDGGCWLLKLHPGTHFLILSFLFLVVRRTGWSAIFSQTTLTACLSFILSCLIYSLFLTGTGNIIVLLDTFLPAALLAFILSRAHPHHLQHVRLVMQLLLASNAILALVEAAVHATLIPLYLNSSAYHPHEEEFRPTALFDHPLTGSVMAMLGLALVPGRGWCRSMYAGLMWAALLAYGGRIAIMVSVAMVCGCQAVHVGSLTIRRHKDATQKVLAAVAMLTFASLLVAAALEIGLGTRLADHFYWDSSAQVRLAQWQLLDHLDGWQLLFGTRREDLLELLVPLRLGAGVEVIENFWLLMFVSLGLLGFPFFLGALSTLFLWCWQRSLLQGRLLLLGVLLVTSTSNSIGRKSTILVCMVATVACLPVRRRAAGRQQGSYGDIYRFAAA